MLELKVVHDDIEVVLEFEHSLLSLSKWEQKHQKPFMTSRQKTPSELLDYFEFMLLTPGVDRNLVYALEPEQMDQIVQYMNTPQTASSVPDDGKREMNQETITSELMYYWLVAMRIPFQPTETWHISRLMMLVQITNFKNQPPKKRKATEVMSDWATINERQKKLLNTRG